MSAQRVKVMLERFEVQEKLKQEILERERQLKRLENKQEEQELKKNIHKQYLRTKYREVHGHSKWSRENSEEVVDKMYKRAFDKKRKIENIEKEKAQKFEAELKTYFKPQILNSYKSWENLKKNEDKINQKRVKVELKREMNRNQAMVNTERRFEQENKNTVYARMQKDLSERRHREGKRNQLKKFKDLHYKEYWKLMDEESDEEHQGNSEIAWGFLVNLLS